MQPTTLSSKVEIYIPSTRNVKEPTDNASWIKKIQFVFSKWFGGASTRYELGTYLDSTDNIVEEPITIVESFCTTNDLEKHMPDVINIAHEMCIDLKQECVAIAVNNQMRYLT
jgi:hypothetical protein